MGNVVLHCDACDQRLRPVAAGHSNDVSAVQDRLPGKFAEIVVRPEEQRLDAPPACLVGQVAALGFPATRLRVDDQHASSRRLGDAGTPARRLSRSLGITHRVASGEAEEHRHSDQHRQCHLVVVRKPEQVDERPQDGGQDKETEVAAPGCEKPAAEGDNEHPYEHQDKPR